jgi:hypothetical protein
MVDARGGKAGGTSGGGGGSLAGYATQAWVNEGFVSIEFFNRLFTAYGPGATSSDPDVAVEPNDLDSTITNIKAMFGLWTEQYLSALGLNPGGTGSATSLSMLDDVNITTPTNGQALVYNATSGMWVNGSAGVDMNTVWNLLAASTNEQINASHLSTALSGYATETWVNNKGYLTSSSLSGYATQTWVSQNYLGISATAAAATKLANARTLWGQSFNGTANVTGSMSNVGDISMDNGSRIYNSTGSGGSLYIGRSDDSGWVKVSDMCSRQGDGYWSVYSNGNAKFANVQSNGYVTALSDIRLKRIIGRFWLDIDKIASASLIRYQWKNTCSKQVLVGGIAQEWQDILPESVIADSDGRLSMNYGVISYASVVSLARKVKDQQKKIDTLEARLAKLEKMFAITGEEEE